MTDMTEIIERAREAFDDEFYDSADERSALAAYERTLVGGMAEAELKVLSLDFACLPEPDRAVDESALVEAFEKATCQLRRVMKGEG